MVICFRDVSPSESQSLASPDLLLRQRSASLFEPEVLCLSIGFEHKVSRHPCLRHCRSSSCSQIFHGSVWDWRAEETAHSKRLSKGFPLK